MGDGLKLNDCIKEALSFRQLFEMDGNIPKGSLAPLEEGETSHSGMYIVTATQNNNAFVVGAFQTHYDAIELLKDEKYRIVDSGGEIDYCFSDKKGDGKTKMFVDEGGGAEGFRDVSTNTIYKIQLCSRMSDRYNNSIPRYITVKIGNDGKPMPKSVVGFAYLGSAQYSMESLLNKTKKKCNTATYTTNTNKTVSSKETVVTSITDNDGTTYLLKVEEEHE